ncbi:MAG: MgtC/SapB family protein [Clostridia bacterium]|nr:MgtC/SapB family protein [Clostridia bacterium]MBQ8428560.1 MgtC/SapB family protein [Clostridia bacterium]MBQ8430076.1 MgtC/SapB family protein [Clostridia bacterium]
MEELKMLLSLLLSVVLGFVIGLERKFRLKEAGIRTHTIVCFGSALMMVVSKNAFGANADTARVAAQIVSGIGFLGAGMIVYRQHEVRGLTTAAGVWATAGIGMACGSGLVSMYYVAVGATAILIAAQYILHLPFRIFRMPRIYSVKIEFVQTTDENLKIKEMFGTDRFNKLVITRENGLTIYSATLNTEKEFSSTRLNEIMAENSFIRSLERCDNE